MKKNKQNKLYTKIYVKNYFFNRIDVIQLGLRRHSSDLVMLRKSVLTNSRKKS